MWGPLVETTAKMFAFTNRRLLKLRPSLKFDCRTAAIDSTVTPMATPQLRSPKTLIFLAVTLVAAILWIRLRNDQPEPLSLARTIEIIESRDVKESERVLRRFGASQNDTVSITLLRGFRALESGRPKIALHYFRDLRPEGAIELPLLLLTGESLYHTGDLAPAEKCFTRLLTASPENVAGHRWMAAIQYDLGHLNASLLYLSHLTILDPDNSGPYAMAGTIYQDLGQLKDSATAFSKALEFSVDTNQLSDIRTRLAAVQMGLKDFEAAEGIIQLLAESDNRSVMLAECILNRGETEKARDLLKSVKDPSNLSSRGKLLQARIYLSDGDAEEALTILEENASALPRDDETQYLMAMASRQLNRLEQAERHLANAAEIKSLKTELTELTARAMSDDDDAEVRSKMAEVCDKLGMHEMSDIWRKAAAAFRSTNAPPSVSE